jgi:ferredoxin
MVKRDIIQIDEDKCNGCGICIPNCHEGALQIVDEKVRLISDLFCDGLGACIGHCPQGAIKIVKREAEAYDEIKVIKEMVKKGDATVQAHLQHLRDHNETEFVKQAEEYLEEHNLFKDFKAGESVAPLFSGCPGSRQKILTPKSHGETLEITSELSQWPVQLNLLQPNSSLFKNADLLIVADCVGIAYPNMHQMIKGKKIAIGCPKFDGAQAYKEKIQAILEMNDLNSIESVIMEVPCCGGLAFAVEQAIADSGKKIDFKKTIINVDGKKRDNHD